MPFFVIFLLIPLIEIAVFIEVGDAVGLGRTLLLCVLTAVIGAFLIKAQGAKVWLEARGTLSKGGLPIESLFDGICIVIAGAFLMTPGFFTDTIGFLLLAPPVRVHLRQWLYSKFEGHIHHNSSHTVHDHDYVEAEYTVIDEGQDEQDDNPRS